MNGGNEARPVYIELRVEVRKRVDVLKIELRCLRLVVPPPDEAGRLPDQLGPPVGVLVPLAQDEPHSEEEEVEEEVDDEDEEGVGEVEDDDPQTSSGPRKLHRRQSDAVSNFKVLSCSFSIAFE